MEDNIRQLQEEIKNENASLMAAVSRCLRLKEPALAQASLKTVKDCQEKIVTAQEVGETVAKETQMS